MTSTPTRHSAAARIILPGLIFTATEFSCENSGRKEEPVKVNTNQVVLIFLEQPGNYRVYHRDSSYTPAFPEIRYIDDHLIVRSIFLKKGGPDTVIIKSSRNLVEFQHLIKGFDRLDYLASNGDTIEITYINFKPYAKNKTKPEQDVQLNYDFYQRKIICHDDYPSLTKVLDPFIFRPGDENFIDPETGKSGFEASVNRARLEAEKLFKLETVTEVELIDSLHEARAIAEDFYQWLLKKQEIRKTLKALNEFALSRDQIKELMLNSPDSLLYYISYRDVLMMARTTQYDRKTKFIVTSNSRMPNYAVVYDSVKNSDFLSNQVKKVLLLDVSDRLIQEGKATQIAEHLTRFEADIQDPEFVDFLKIKHKLKTVSTELELAGVDGTKTTLQKLLTRHKGKVIYLDFWASWCGPCIAMFPDSKKLEVKLNHKDLIFAFISIDENPEQWKKGIEKHQLPDSTSFLVENFKSSKFIEETVLNSIPRYMIVAKNGEIVNQNAPRPNDVTLKNLLLKQLNTPD